VSFSQRQKHLVLFNQRFLAWFALLSVGDPDSPIELVDQAPAEIKLTRLDIDSADQLAGWQILPPEFQN